MVILYAWMYSPRRSPVGPRRSHTDNILPYARIELDMRVAVDIHHSFNVHAVQFTDECLELRSVDVPAGSPIHLAGGWRASGGRVTA